MLLRIVFNRRLKKKVELKLANLQSKDPSTQESSERRFHQALIFLEAAASFPYPLPFNESSKGAGQGADALFDSFRH